VDRASRSKWFGFSVRCVRNNILAGDIPEVTTNNISDLTSTTAISGGNVTGDGGAQVTARGVCWSLAQYPTILDYKTSDGSGTGSFTSNISGLITNSTYYLRAYATNSNGTGYGKIMSFLAQGVPTGTVTDIEGNVYITVTIGTQVWMAENLKTTKFNNGTTIPQVTGATTWSNLTSPGYCWNLYNDYYKEPYRALYNWYTINTGNLCPTGWHVPTDAEWTILISYLGGQNEAGGKLKEIGTTHWHSPNTGATNETGFTALPGGYQSTYYGTFMNIGKSSIWWSTTEYSSNSMYPSTSAYYLELYYTLSSSNSIFSDKKFGQSVRCIKD